MIDICLTLNSDLNFTDWKTDNEITSIGILGM